MNSEESEIQIAQFDGNLAELRLDNSNNKLNCFINSVLFAFWHIPTLRESIIQYSRTNKNINNTQEHMIVNQVKVSSIFPP